MTGTPISTNRSTLVTTLLVSGLVSTATGLLVFLMTREGRQKRRQRQYDSKNGTDREWSSSNLDEDLPAPRRHGGAIQLRLDQYQRYRELHDNVWPQVLDRMTKSNIRNFTIYYHKETSILFQHYEWIGHWKEIRRLQQQQQQDQQSDQSKFVVTLTREQEQELFDVDMKAIADDPITRLWWRECEPSQQPFAQWPPDAVLLSEGGSPDSGNSWWAPLECVAHCGHWPIAYTTQQRDPDFETLVRQE